MVDMSTMDLARARQAAGNVSKSELARRLGIPVRNVRRMENTPGYDPRFSRVLEIARALGVSTDSLVPERAHEANLPEPEHAAPHSVTETHTDSANTANGTSRGRNVANENAPGRSNGA